MKKLVIFITSFLFSIPTIAQQVQATNGVNFGNGNLLIEISGTGAPIGSCSSRERYIQVDATVGANVWECILGVWAHQGNGTVSQSVTFNSSNSGASSPVLYNGSTPVTISTNTIGAVPVTTTVNGNALSGNINVTASQITSGTLPHAQLPSLISTDIPNNSANTTGNAANVTGIIAPANGGLGSSTVPTAGQIPVGNVGGTLYAPITMSGDCSFLYTGGITCTKSNGTGFGTGAFATISNYLTTVAAASTYLTQSSAATTYSSLANANTYSNTQDYTTAVPTFVGGLNAVTSLTGLGWVRVIGRYAYATGDSTNQYSNSNSDNLSVIDIGNPAAPKIIGQVTSTQLKSAEGLECAGNYCYVLPYGYFVVVNISNPYAPTQVSYIFDNTHLALAEGIAISGKYAYVVGGETGVQYLNVIDISNPAAPIIISSTGSADLATGESLTVKGNYAYACTANGVLSIWNISNPLAPVETSHITSVGTGIYVQGRYAYAIGTNTLNILDVSNPAVTPTIVGTTSMSGVLFWTIKVAGRYAYVTDFNSCAGDLGCGPTYPNALYVFDISAPTAPTLAATVIDNTNLYGADDIFIDGDYAYVTLNNIAASGGFSIFRLTGTNETGANIGNLNADDANVNNDLIVGKDARVTNGLIVGPQGVNSNGPINTTISETTTQLILKGSTPTMVAGSAAGSGPSCTSVSGTNMSGTVTCTTGGSTTTGTLSTITFNQTPIAITVAPNACYLFPAAATDVMPTGSFLVTGQPSTTSWTINVYGAALSTSSTYEWRYLCI